MSTLHPADMAFKPPAMLKSLLHGEGRPSSAPSSQNMENPQAGHLRSSSIPARNRMASEPLILKELAMETCLDLTGLLDRSESSVVKTRTGSVLSRGFILKTDYYPSGT